LQGVAEVQVPGEDLVTLQPMVRADLSEVGQFLHDNLNSRLSPATWASAAIPPWQVDSPNYGYLLLAGDRIVGVHLAFYSERLMGENRIRLCNLGAFCVRKEYRSHSLRLLRALLAQDSYHFTDLSPSGNVVPVNVRLKFRHLDTATALVPNLPWPLWPLATRVISDPASIEARLHGRDLTIYRDHAHAAAALHALIVRGNEVCYVMFRRDRRKNLPLFASILHVGNPELFRRASQHFFRHLLLHHKIPATLAEIRVAGHRPPLSVMLPAPRPKMFRSGELRGDDVDYLYSELTCVPW
jgi:hypothetical protein